MYNNHQGEQPARPPIPPLPQNQYYAHPYAPVYTNNPPQLPPPPLPAPPRVPTPAARPAPPPRPSSSYDIYSTPFIPPGPPPLPPKLALAAAATRNRPPSPPQLPLYSPAVVVPPPFEGLGDVKSPDAEGFPAAQPNDDDSNSEEAQLARVLAQSAAEAAAARAQEEDDEELRRAIQESLALSASASTSPGASSSSASHWQEYDPAAFGPATAHDEPLRDDVEDQEPPLTPQGPVPDLGRRDTGKARATEYVLSAPTPGEEEEGWQEYDPRAFDFPRSVNDDLRSVSEHSITSHSSSSEDSEERREDELRMLQEMQAEEEHFARERAAQIAADEELAARLLEEEGIVIPGTSTNPFRPSQEVTEEDRIERLAHQVEAALRRKLQAAGEALPPHLAEAEDVGEGEGTLLPMYSAAPPLQPENASTSAGPITTSPRNDPSQLPYLSPPSPAPGFPVAHPHPHHHQSEPAPAHSDENVQIQRPHLRPHAASVPAPPEHDEQHLRRPHLRPHAASVPPRPHSAVPSGSRPLSTAPSGPRPVSSMTPRQAEKQRSTTSPIIQEHVGTVGGFSPLGPIPPPPPLPRQATAPANVSTRTSPILQPTRPVSAPNKQERERLLMGAHNSPTEPHEVRVAGMDVPHLDVGLDDGVMSHISFGFAPPSMAFRLPPAPPIPDVIALASFPSPAFHMQAPSWRALLRALAHMSDTKLEPTPRSLQRLGVARLRAVVQFVKAPLGESAWRTILFLSLDNPVPRGTPAAWKWSNGDTAKLPYNFPTPPPPPPSSTGTGTGHTLLVSTPDAPLFAFTAPHAELPLSMPALARFLTEKMAESRAAAKKDSSSSLRRLAKIVEVAYPEVKEPRVREPGERRAMIMDVLMFKRGFLGKKKGSGGGLENDQTYDLVTPFRMDEWG
ncbi:hypothetical protein EXIGLDRAFT_485259 [Exidia glandulosa HHB12029]|uniref:Uncharacterized protein n=1 Tax=Exidia glandulosa HHB12029 TaxID=1314781 RepID=A0A165JQ90_EXIGL|nr:hypothetical protein EXIGLDRAFT_485259 [Exidia glandulosa HHB12029]